MLKSKTENVLSQNQKQENYSHFCFWFGLVFFFGFCFNVFYCHLPWFASIVKFCLSSTYFFMFYIFFLFFDFQRLCFSLYILYYVIFFLLSCLISKKHKFNFLANAIILFLYYFFLLSIFCMQFECKKVTETGIFYIFLCVKEEEKERKINI